MEASRCNLANRDQETIGGKERMDGRRRKKLSSRGMAGGRLGRKMANKYVKTVLFLTINQINTNSGIFFT